MKTDLKTLNFKQILSGIEAMVFDVDGVLSNSEVLINENGTLQRTANVRDGYILKYALKKGIKIGIISGGLNESVKLRYQALGIEDVIIGSKRKIYDFEEFTLKHKINNRKVLYMGDDIPDYEVMKVVGLPCCPADAADEIKQISMYISPKKGGDACVRDIAEQVLRAKKLWMDDDAFNM